MEFIFVILVVVLLSLLPLYALIFIIIPFIFGASYEGSKPDVIQKMIKYSKAKKDDKIADLGSGDGRIVIAFAEKGIEAHGYEVNPLLVLWSRRKIKQKGLEKKAFIHWQNFWNVDLSKFNVINVFQISFIMKKLESKLERELPAGARIISNTWEFPSMVCLEKDNDVFVYQK
jgi:hypothetical protein